MCILKISCRFSKAPSFLRIIYVEIASSFHQVPTCFVIPSIMRIKVLILIVVVYEGFIEHIEMKITKNMFSNEIKYNELDEHTLVTDSDVFPFVVAILMKSKFISAGALIDNSWVLTSADSFFLLREASRTIRVRLGSINYRKGGIVRPIKYIAIHPEFDDETPSYDLAMIRLSEPVRYMPSLKPIRLQRTLKEIDATHFTVPSWPNPMSISHESEQLKSTELIKRRRLLSVTHLHPTDEEDCEEDLLSKGVNDTENIMCLDTGVMIDPCSRDVGAPVVLNGLLWGIVSSWRPNTCDNNTGSTFVVLVSAPNISSWIHATQHGHRWEVSDEKK